MSYKLHIFTNGKVNLEGSREVTTKKNGRQGKKKELVFDGAG